MRTLAALAALAALLVAAAAGPAAASPARAARACHGVTAAGHFYPVRIVRGRIACPHARSILRTAIEDAMWPKGWHCFYGHGDDVWAIQCLAGQGEHPRIWIRAANPSG